MKFNIVRKTVNSDKDVMFVDNSNFIEDTYPNNTDDNIRIYVPLDINQDSVMDRLYNIISRYKEATEENEMSFSVEVTILLNQLDVYDQYWFKHEDQSNGKHSKHGTELAQKILEELQSIPDGCAECFPFETIDQLKAEYDL